MSGFLLDTNCISEIVSPRPSESVLQWMEDADENKLYLSVLTFGEIRIGLAKLPQGKRRASLESWLEVQLKMRFAGRIIPIDEPVAQRWGLLAAEAVRKGKSLPVLDSLLAATALLHNLTIVSRNVRNFKNTQVRVLNPWE